MSFKTLEVKCSVLEKKIVYKKFLGEHCAASKGF